MSILFKITSFKQIQVSIPLSQYGNHSVQVSRAVSRNMSMLVGYLWLAEVHTMEQWMDGMYRRKRPRKSRKDNIKEWTGQSISSLLRVAEDERRWATITSDASVGVPQRRLGVTGFDWQIDS